MSYLLTNCRVYTGDAILGEHDVLVHGTTIQAVLPRQHRPAHVTQVDGRGLLVCPGLVDLQLYGGGESAFGLAPSGTALLQLRQHTLRQGTTSFLPTVPTNAPAVLDHALAVVREALPTMPGLLGLHLEGPYISPHKRGVHPAEFVQAPTLASLRELLEQGRGVLRMLTLAPEVLGPAERALLQAADLVLSAGHSNARSRACRPLLTALPRPRISSMPCPPSLAAPRAWWERFMMTPPCGPASSWMAATVPTPVYALASACWDHDFFLLAMPARQRGRSPIAFIRRPTTLWTLKERWRARG